MGDRQYGIDPQRLAEYAAEIKQIHDKGVEIAIVIGGGNIFRGVAGASNGMDRVQVEPLICCMPIIIIKSLICVIGLLSLRN